MMRQALRAPDVAWLPTIRDETSKHDEPTDADPKNAVKRYFAAGRATYDIDDRTLV